MKIEVHHKNTNDLATDGATIAIKLANGRTATLFLREYWQTVGNVVLTIGTLDEDDGNTVLARQTDGGAMLRIASRPKPQRP